MKPVTDITAIRLMTLVSMETRWGKRPEFHDALKGVSDLVPLHGYIMEMHSGGLTRHIVNTAYRGKLVRLPEEKWHGPGSLVFDKSCALKWFGDTTRYVPMSTQVIAGKLEGPRRTRGGIPIQSLEYRFIVCSEAAYDELIFARRPSLVVTYRRDFECALAGGRDQMFEDEEAA